MLLADACTIHSGYTARGRLEATEFGGVLAIQLRDISAEGVIHPERLTRVQLEDLADRYFVRAGDVVFRSRGERNTASVLDKRLRERALAVLPLLVLRPKHETQEKIVAIDALAEQERALALLVAETRRKMMSLILVERANRLRPKTRQERTSK